MKKVREIISFGIADQSESCPHEFWYNGVECSQLVADTYKIAITILDSNKSNMPTLLVPISGNLSEGKPIVLQLNSYHYNLLTVDDNCIYPPIDPIYKKINLDMKTLETNVKRHIRIQFQRQKKINKDVIII